MAYSLSPRENYLLAMEHKPTEFIPLGMLDTTFIGFMHEYEKGPEGGGKDGFGVNWVYPEHRGINGPIPEPDNFVLKDITRWKKDVTFPDLDAFDWEKAAETELAPFNRDMVVVEFATGNAQFERLAALMGFEGALLAMVLEPEATFELLSAITDFKIEIMKKVAKHYKPDTFVFHDDIATERSLFMSPDTYRQLIKPNHTRLCDAIWEAGIIPVQHTCGKADECIDDYVETGAAAWTVVQSPNDIVGILTKYKGKFTLIGGFDWQGPPGLPDATQEVIDAEVHRMLNEYSHLDGFIGSYLPFSVLMGDPDAPPMPPEEAMAARQKAIGHYVGMVREFEATKWRK